MPVHLTSYMGVRAHTTLPCLRQRAALRKLRHELGIAPEALSARGFRFLTRLHYCAPDRGTYGPDAEWGEHEVSLLLVLHYGGLAWGKVLLGGAKARRMLWAREVLLPEMTCCCGYFTQSVMMLISSDLLTRGWCE